jgi:hypothetical protein
MANKKKKPEEKSPKPKKTCKRKLSDEAMKWIIRQYEVTFFDKCKNLTRVHLENGDIKFIPDSLELISPKLNKKKFMRTHVGYRVNLTLFVSEEVNGQGLLATMKCGRKAKVTKKLKVEFRKRLSKVANA